MLVSVGTAFAAATAGKLAWDYGVERVEAQIKLNNQTSLENELDEAFDDGTRPVDLLPVK